MPTYMLEGEAAVALPARPLTVTLQTRGPVQGTLLARGDAGSETELVRPRPELLVLPRVSERIVLRIEPLGAATFPQGTLGNVSVAANDPDANDPERAVLPPIDLAGLTGRDVLSVEPCPEGVRIRSEVEQLVRLQLDPLAEAARVAATERLGVQRLDRRLAVETIVEVDPSASFRPHVEEGRLARVLSLLEGVAAVVSPRLRPEALIACAPPVPVAPAEQQPFSEAVVRAVRAIVPTTGTAPSEEPAPERTVRYFLSDAVPPLSVWPGRSHRPPEALAHLVVLGHESAWRLERYERTPATLVDLDALGPAGTDPDPLLQRPQLLHGLVASLLAGIGGRGERA